MSVCRCSSLLRSSRTRRIYRNRISYVRIRSEQERSRNDGAIGRPAFLCCGIIRDLGAIDIDGIALTVLHSDEILNVPLHVGIIRIAVAILVNRT